MKLAFTGSHSTGKTTLIQEIIKEAPNTASIKCVTEIARKIIRRGYLLNNEATEASYIQYINDQLYEERDIECYDYFLSDRTLLDPLAYMIANKDFPGPTIEETFIQMMENVWLLEQTRYDFYIYFPVEFPLVFDGVRPNDEKYREAVDKEILYLLNKHSIPFISVTGSVPERKKQILHLLGWR